MGPPAVTRFLWQKKHNHWGPTRLDQLKPKTPSNRSLGTRVFIFPQRAISRSGALGARLVPGRCGATEMRYSASPCPASTDFTPLPWHGKFRATGEATGGWARRSGVPHLRGTVSSESKPLATPPPPAYDSHSYQVPPPRPGRGRRRIGKTVRIRCGAAAVIGQALLLISPATAGQTPREGNWGGP